MPRAALGILGCYAVAGAVAVAVAVAPSAARPPPGHVKQVRPPPPFRQRAAPAPMLPPRPLQTTTTTVVTLPPTTTTSSSGLEPTTLAEWTRVAVCEEGGWIGYAGAAYPDSLGISAQAWQEFGGGSDLSPAAQIAVAQRIEANAGLAGYVPDQYGCASW